MRHLRWFAAIIALLIVAAFVDVGLWPLIPLMVTVPTIIRNLRPIRVDDAELTRWPNGQ